IIQPQTPDDDFYGAIFSMNYQKNRLDLKVGGAWNRYEGLHFGEVIWAEFASNGEIRDRYYENDAEKSDFNVYGKMLYQLNPRLSVFLDLQYRRVGYSFLGLAVDDALGSRPLQQNSTHNFFNPKIGLSYRLNSNHSIYSSFSVGNKEPNRNDFVQSSPQSRPRPERLYDLEAGYRFQSSQVAFGLNAYAMLYEDQLVVTGAVNDVGAFNRQNVNQSYRIGLEFEFAWKLGERFQWDFNTTLSQNRIQDFVESVDFFGSEDDLTLLEAQGFVRDAQSGQLTRNLGNTDIAFSPNLTLGSQLNYSPVNNLTISLLTHVLSQQADSQVIDRTVVQLAA
ncbi:MAG: TonB-dependent receptor, partial [Bacteroidota bacterium]